MSPDPQPPETLLPVQWQAIVNRLQARLGSGVADAAASLMAAAQEAPGRVNQEWQLFWQEVELEADRLSRADAAPAPAPAPEPTDPQQQIDALRAKVAAISQRLDG